MSGGHFNYEDARALDTVAEILAEDLGRREHNFTYYGDTEPDELKIKNIKSLLAASKILKQWLHDYDWECSGDSHRFDESTESAMIELHALTKENI